MRIWKTPILIAIFSLQIFRIVGFVFADEDRSVRENLGLSIPLEKKHLRPQNKAVVGIVEKMLGPGYAQAKGKGSKSGISIGHRVFEGDRVISEKSRMHVRYKDGAYIQLGEETSFEVERVRFKAPNQISVNKANDEFDESVFRFLYGIVRVTAPEVHEKAHFTVKTSNAVLKALGPADFFLIQFAGDRDLTLRVNKGTIHLINAITNEHMEVREGKGAYLKVTGMVTEAGRFTEEQKRFLISRTEI